MVHTETEAWGLTYERYALELLQKEMAKKYSVKTVAEIPAHGVKAMPSIYSIGFGLAGCSVTLVNGNENYISEWRKLGIDSNVRFVDVNSIYEPGIEDNSFDLVWSFAYLPGAENPEKLIKTMAKISNKYVAIFSVNAGNVGFPIHRALHKINKVPWTHGDIKYNSIRNVEKLLKENGVKVIKRGYVDTPPWPDSLGFRDMRLHKSANILENANWVSPYISMRQDNSFPSWVKLVYLFEKIPMPMFLKTRYSHIFYVVGEVV